MTEALLFDLDDTLIEEVRVAEEALRATAERARSAGVEPERLAGAVRARARELWHAHRLHPWARRIGVSSWEALWARFAGEQPEVVALRRWAPEYRWQAWRRGLADCGVDDPALAEELATSFPSERRARHRPYPDTHRVLEALRGTGRALGLVTNGLSCLQRDKARGADVERHFDAVVVSADVGAGKPDPLPLVSALERLGVSAKRAAMIGNRPETDLAAARAAGVAAIWVDRVNGSPAAAVDADADARVGSLEELLGLFGGGGPAGFHPG